MTSSNRPLQESDLIFSSASSGIKDALGELKRSNLSISNRLHSIKRDAEFVQEVAEAYQLPLIANERCGSWYIPPELKKGSGYFKSTDGHFGQWSFSLRRLNMQVPDIIGEKGGCVIVDSTRRGKSMPDALSKTIPIWICVLNRLLFPELTEGHELHTPEDMVSESEHSQIEERVPAFVESIRSLDLDISKLRAKLLKPMLPVWVTPASCITGSGHARSGSMHKIVLCTASSRSSEENRHSSDYVQGAADDSESWAHSLDANTFWTHHGQLLATSEDGLPDLIRCLVAETRSKASVRKPTLILPTKNIWIADNAAAEQMHQDFELVVSCSEAPSCAVSDAHKGRYIHLTCATGKNGSRQLRAELPKLRAMPASLRPSNKILVTCQTGRDLAVGVALALLCEMRDGDDTLRAAADPFTPMNKTLIKHRLNWIMISMPDASPSRATLQSVNAYLMR